MTALTNTDPNTTYKDLLQMGTGTGGGLTSSVQTVQDGQGNSSALGLATNMVTATAFKIGSNQITLGGALTTSGAVTFSASFSAVGAISLGGSLTTGGNVTVSGAFSTTLTITAGTSVTLPTTGTLATLAGSEALTNKTLNGLTVTSSTGTLTIAAAKVVTISNTLTLAGADSTTITFQGTDTYVGRATTDTLTNKTFDTAGTGNVLKINGTAISAKTGTGSVVLATSPTIATATLTSPTMTTPVLGTPTSGTLTNCTGYTNANLPAKNLAISLSSGAYANGTSALLQITNFSNTITTTGRQVIIQVVPDGNTTNAATLGMSSSGSTLFTLKRDGTVVGLCTLAVAASTTTVPPSTVSFIDSPTAGSHTYILYTTNTSSNSNVSYCSLLTYEV